ncbi:Hsp33 family molecular chaperone [Parvularcula sp. ZS-1/3]|uniref:Hsp33 family molecular chaperone n=1 Tax=Parvularcula mediterranea TaxID=2732508 RepID=A0A7Y3RLW3_9PROT|nr:Hsp33 family molecular chaperone [Parvularcula mediterranea]NNU16487.1 Hsp33 family molecular chaperone [Parvularcula mediterranea]
MFDEAPKSGGPTDDVVIPFQVGETAVRGRLVRLGPAIDDLLRRHTFPKPVKELVGQTAALVAMLGASLKFEGKLILQVQGDGPVSMIVADYTVGGALRATAKLQDGHDEIAGKAEGPELHFLLRKGHMVMTIDQGADMERYQGVVPLEGPTIAKATVNYFAQSEQIPTAIELAVGQITDEHGRETWRAGGIMAQFMAGEGGSRERGEDVLMEDDDREAWNRAAILLETVKPDELLDPTVSPEQLLYRLYHEDGVRVFDPSTAHFECTCNREKIANVLSQYTREDIDDMIEDGALEVTCDFCRQVYRFELDESGERFTE